MVKLFGNHKSLLRQEWKRWKFFLAPKIPKVCELFWINFHFVGDIFGGAFVGFVPQQPMDETILYEDGMTCCIDPTLTSSKGFMVMLSDGSWSLLRKCLAQGRNCLIQSDTEKGLNAQIQFLDEESEKAEAEAHEHGPKPGEGAAEMMIMTPQMELKERIEMDDLAGYAKQIINLLKAYITQVRWVGKQRRHENFFGLLTSCRTTSSHNS